MAITPRAREARPVCPRKGTLGPRIAREPMAVMARMASIPSLLSLLLPASHARAVNWEQQAERLQRISATLLDGLPIPSPPSSRYGLGVAFDTSLLPKPNPRVGDKKEKVPSSPVHAIPSLRGHGLWEVGESLKAGATVHGGYLVPGLEGLFGVKAKLSQYSYGAAGHLSYAVNPTLNATGDAGFHNTGGEATGAITSPSAKDTFTFSTLALYLAPGLHVPRWGTWANTMIGYRISKSELRIPSDDTDLKTEDSLEDVRLPVFFQIAAGWTHAPTGATAGLAYLVVPERLYMPRLALNVIYPMGPRFPARGQTSPAPPGAGDGTRTRGGPEGSSAGSDASESPEMDGLSRPVKKQGPGIAPGKQPPGAPRKRKSPRRPVDSRTRGAKPPADKHKEAAQ